MSKVFRELFLESNLKKFAVTFKKRWDKEFDNKKGDIKSDWEDYKKELYTNGIITKDELKKWGVPSLLTEAKKAKKSKSDPIFTTDYSIVTGGLWNTAGRILLNIRMYSTGKRAGKTQKRLLGDIYNPPSSEYSFEEMEKKGYVTVKDGGYYITKKGSDAIKKASGY